MSATMGGRKVVRVEHYRFTGKRLGKGNFAVVEEALHTVLNAKVAIKIMDVNEIKEDYVVRNLYREAKILARLSHPSIATLFQTMQHGNMYYLVLELIGGGDLCNFIRAQRNGRLEEHSTRHYGRQLISAVSHMHGLGIVHRDLKMENIMLSASNDRIKVVDFGLSNLYVRDRLLHTHCGSPEYAAPELFVEGKPYGPEVDLWSVGVILYGMAVGQLPFVSGSRTTSSPASHRREKLIEQINKGFSSPQRKALAALSADFRAMVAKLLVADARKRIAIGELIFHPWVTEKGRRAIRSNPLKKLDTHARFDIIQEVATASEKPWQEVQRALRAEPQGSFAGMFNVLAHRAARHALDAELILSRKNVPTTSRSLSTRPTDAAKNARGKSTDARRQDTARSTPAPRASIHAPRKPTTPNAAIFKEAPLASGDRQFKKPAAAKRANDSDSGTPQGLAKTASVEESGAKPRARANPTGSPAGDMPRDLVNEYVFNTGPAQNTRSKKPKIESLVKQLYSPACPRTIKRSDRLLSAAVQAPENRPSYNNKATPQTARPSTTNPLSSPPARPAKRRSLLPVLQVTKATASATTGFRNGVMAKTRLHQVTKSAPLDRIDDPKRVSNNGGTARKVDLSNEPIARSIAGYMTRNIKKPTWRH